ncbi:MAG: hypothetical protein ACLQAT_15670 [Candidatus Binataceae bacterium]
MPVVSVRLGAVESELLAQTADRRGKTKASLIREAVRLVVNAELQVQRDSALEQRLCAKIETFAVRMSRELSELRDACEALQQPIIELAKLAAGRLKPSVPAATTHQPNRQEVRR